MAFFVFSPGGNNLTLTGSSFAADLESIEVTVGGVPCTAGIQGELKQKLNAFMYHLALALEMCHLNI